MWSLVRFSPVSFFREWLYIISLFSSESICVEDFWILGEIYQSYTYIYIHTCIPILMLKILVVLLRICQEKARVQCKNDQCTWSGTRSQEAEHALTCLYLKVTCPHCLVETRQVFSQKTQPGLWPRGFFLVEKNWRLPWIQFARLLTGLISRLVGFFLLCLKEFVNTVEQMTKISFCWYTSYQVDASSKRTTSAVDVLQRILKVCYQ